MARVNIDGKDYDLQAGQNLLHACLSERLDLPYFCWHPAMGSVGSCRLCAIIDYADEADQRGRLQMACTMPVRDGMRISIGATFAADFRKQVIEWLMQNHPHDCPVCEEGGECHLQDMTVMTGHSMRRYAGLKRTWQNQYLGPFVGHEMNRCITCYRCVRYYRDYAGGTDLDAFGSRSRMFFGRQEDGVLESEFAGNLVEVCPTGVFTDKPFSQAYSRKWDLQSAPSVCPNCAVGCNTFPAERYGQLKRVHNRYHGQLNGYFLCDRGRYGSALCEPREAHSPCWRARRRWHLRSTRPGCCAGSRRGALGCRTDRHRLAAGISRSQLRVAAVWWVRTTSALVSAKPKQRRCGQPSTPTAAGASAFPRSRKSSRQMLCWCSVRTSPIPHLASRSEYARPPARPPSTWPRPLASQSGRTLACGATASRPKARSSLPPWPRRASMNWPRGPAMARRRSWRVSASTSPTRSPTPSLAAQTISHTPQHRPSLAPNARW